LLHRGDLFAEIVTEHQVSIKVTRKNSDGFLELRHCGFALFSPASFLASSNFSRAALGTSVKKRSPLRQASDLAFLEPDEVVCPD
jgi:hypothetical protein